MGGEGGHTVLYTFVNAGVGSHSTEVRVAGSLHRLKQNSSIHHQNIFFNHCTHYCINKHNIEIILQSQPKSS